VEVRFGSSIKIMYGLVGHKIMEKCIIAFVLRAEHQKMPKYKIRLFALMPI